ncbi:MAG: hypothetical protein RMA76_35915 [Deltaproteobacteria bacterium]|jgi:uncharacterized membrane protein YebE (DUF533 family)
MSEITYERIQPLIAATEQRGSSMHATFTCPVTGVSVASTASIQRGKGLVDVAKQSAKKNVMWSIRSSVARTVRSVLGSGILGRVGTDMAREVMKNVEQGAKDSFSDDEKNAAVVQAFEAVASTFVWDPKRGQFVGASATEQSGFDAQLANAPVTEKFDRGVLARLLVEIAAADGKVDDDERAFLENFVTPDVGTVDALLTRGALSGADLGETAQGASRETMIMLAWAVAFADEELEMSETRRIVDAAQHLGVGGDRVDTLKHEAQLHLYDQALGNVYASGSQDTRAKADADAFAGRIGMSAEDIERADARYRRRHGLV